MTEGWLASKHALVLSSFLLLLLLLAGSAANEIFVRSGRVREEKELAKDFSSLFRDTHHPNQQTGNEKTNADF